MKQQFKKHLKFGLFLFGIALMIYSCQKDDDLSKTQALQLQFPEKKSRVQVKTGVEVSKPVVDYIKQKTNNNLFVEVTNERVSLTNGSTTTRSSAFGTVDTSKEIVVVNESNTKHTFKVDTPDQPSTSITNLIVVETIDTTTYEYFLKYNFDGNVPYNYNTKSIDLSQFNGTIQTYDNTGAITGTLIVNSGDIIDTDGITSPCPEEEDNNDNNAGGGSGSGSVGGGYVPGGETYIEDAEIPCGLSYHYKCDGGVTGLHDPAVNITLPTGVCNGGVLVVTDCNGDVLAQGRTGELGDPCSGTTGVLLLNDDCDVRDDVLNASYSANSPFNVDLSNVRANCDDTIDLSQVEANAKFMCIYNKLANSPKFKNLFIDTFGENEDINVEFNILNIPIPNGQSSPPNGTSHVTDFILENGEVTSVDVLIQIDKDYINNSGGFFVAQTIMHESIHAYLQLKMKNCNLGTSLDLLNDTTLESILSEYFDGSCTLLQEDHEFMFDFMIPTMSDILADIKDDLISQEEQQAAEGQTTFQNENTINGLPYQPWNWEQFYYYTNLLGLQNTSAFTNEILSSSQKITNFYDYELYSTTNFNSPCND